MSFYFFADINNLNDQTDNSFGPAENVTVDGAGYEQYLVTSMHTATQPINAIAVCKGQIFVQEQSQNPNLLNIILKPLDSQPFQFPKVKYFIYKGINKASLVAANDTDIAAQNTNDLVDSIWKVSISRGLSENPSKSILGLAAATNVLGNSFLLEDVFNSTYPGVQFWNVLAGTTIGKFDDNSIGFEIVLDSLYYQPSLEIARNSQTFIQAQTLDESPVQKDFFEHWHDKEMILHFMDPCAFFGGFYKKNLNVVSGDQITSIQGVDLYNNLLSKFMNKNICYIDIRNEFNYSINYYKNYGTSPTDNTTNIYLRKGQSGTFSTIDYYGNSWPILVIDGSDFSDANEDHHVLSIQLPTGNGDNPAPLVYFAKAYNNNAFPDEFLEKEKFISLSVTDNYTDEFSLGIPWIVSNPVCCFTYLKFCKQLTSDTLPDVTPTQIRRTDYLDSLFPISMNFESINSIIQTKVYDEELYIDVSDTHFFDATFNLAISFSGGNVTLLANPYIVNQTDRKKVRRVLELSSEFKSTGDDDNILYNLWNNTERSDLVINTLNTSNNDLNVLNYETSGADIQGQFQVEDLRKIIALNLTLSQWHDIVQLSNSSFLSKYDVFLSIINKQYLEDEGENSYTSLDLTLKGFQIDGDNLVLQQVLTNINLIAYGIV
jgi:hypothetical protein